MFIGWSLTPVDPKGNPARAPRPASGTNLTVDLVEPPKSPRPDSAGPKITRPAPPTIPFPQLGPGPGRPLDPSLPAPPPARGVPDISVGPSVRYKGSPELQGLPFVENAELSELTPDQFTHYIFSSRVNARLGPEWVSQVSRTLKEMTDSRFEETARQHRTTDVEVVLSPEGKIIDVVFHRRSGSDELDDAVAQTFSELREFPNPPSELLEEDGLIRRRYRFTVYFLTRRWTQAR